MRDKAQGEEGAGAETTDSRMLLALNDKTMLVLDMWKAITL